MSDGASLGPSHPHVNELTAPVMEWVEWSNALERAASWLDGIRWQMASGGDVGVGMMALHHGLSLLRRKWDREEWRRFCLEVARTHPLGELLHRCPFTRHGFERPRGYAGDAALIDYLYTEGRTSEPHPGQLIYHFMYQQPSPRSVRERRRLLARELDDVAERVHLPRILSVACGHLREAETSRAVRERRIGELIAFDQDPLSLAEVSRQHPENGPVRTACDSVRSILLGRTRFEGLDLAYSAGLYDYLAEGTARRLTRLLFEMLRPGGRLVLANFASCPEAGYLEAFMDWWLIYRDEAQVQGFLAEINPEQIASQQLFRDSEQNVIYLTLTRR